jgi:HNH endonuclease
VCGAAWRKPAHDISDRAKRYRANAPECRPPLPAECALCGSTRFLVIDHIDDDESNNCPDNLRWLCKSCNTRLGISMARASEGRRTRQYNPGASTLAQYTEAVLAHSRGEHDAGGKIIHETSKEKRQEFAVEIWRRRRRHGTDHRHRL